MDKTGRARPADAPAKVRLAGGTARRAAVANVRADPGRATQRGD